jgi:hypothetical protein
MDINRTKIIACATVIEEMLPLLPKGMAYEVLDFGLHLSPPNLREKLQAAVNASSPRYDTLLLGYGLCSMAVIGLKANGCRLVIPRTDDCIGIFLGSQAAYSEQVRQEAGTYYLTKGWIEVADTPFDEYERLVAQYGVERANRIMSVMLKNYKRLVYIDTGHQDNARYVEIARRTAEKFNLRFEEVRGSNALIVKMLKGEWDDDFLVVEAGQTVSYLDFKLVQPKIEANSIPAASASATEKE